MHELGYCEGVLTWLIRAGVYGDLRLDGFGVVSSCIGRARFSTRTVSSVF